MAGSGEATAMQATLHKVAPDPFNNTSADTILRSSDDVDFFVQRGILITSSTFFETMFSLPQPQTNPSRIEPITMSESSRTLGILLRCCYPRFDRILTLTVKDLRVALEAAMKYEMLTATKLLRRRLFIFARQYPLQAYAIACVLKLEPEARHAAEEAIKLPSEDFDVYVSELEELPAGCYHRLLQFRSQADRTGNFDFVSAVPGTRSRNALEFVTSEPSQNQWQEAGPPFDRSDSDTIVASQNQVRFRVHSMVLKVIYPVFEDMLTNKEPYPHAIFEQDAEAQNVTYYLTLPETSNVLIALFGPSYHSFGSIVFDESIRDRSVLHAVTKAALKYSVDGILRVLKSHHLAHGEPLQGWLSAILYGWTDSIKVAALKTLAVDFTQLQATYDSHLEEISSGPYFRLLRYHKKCGNAAKAAVNGPSRPISVGTKAGHQSGSNMPSCYVCEKSPKDPINLDLRRYTRTTGTLLQERPHVSILSEPELRAELSVEILCHACKSCPRISLALEKADVFQTSLKERINKAISKVKIE